MKRIFRTTGLITLALAMLGACFVSPAHAQCVAILSANTVMTQPQFPDGAGQFVDASFVQKGSEADHIVGLWKAQFVAEGNEAGPPDGTVVDSPLVQWHGDGTEFMNSIKLPKTGSVCMGVWRRTSKLRYTLNHFALAFTDDGSAFLGPAQIQEHIILDKKGNSYSGTFTITQDDAAGNQLAQVKGNVTATRITVDTTINQVL